MVQREQPEARAAAGGPKPSLERAEVDRLYGKYNPEKLVDVDTLVAKHGEVKLLGMVRKKYREQEGGGQAPCSACGVALEVPAGVMLQTS